MNSAQTKKLDGVARHAGQLIARAKGVNLQQRLFLPSEPDNCY